MPAVTVFTKAFNFLCLELYEFIPHLQNQLFKIHFNIILGLWLPE